MERIPGQALHDQTASVLARVASGEIIEITNDDDKPIARIIPTPGGELDDWVASGRAMPATSQRPFRMPEGEVDPTADAGALIRQLRDEERW